MKTIIVLLSLLLASFFCAAEDIRDNEVRASFISNLKDPNSVQWGPVEYVDASHACVYFNAKGGFGGYTGMKIAFMYNHNDKWEYLGATPNCNFTTDELFKIDRQANKN